MSTETIRLSDVSIWLIGVAGIVSILGAPHPNAITWVEYVMAACLLSAVVACIPHIKWNHFKELWICIAYLACVPLSIGMANGYGIHEIMRDYLPLGYVVVMPVLIMMTSQVASRATEKFILASMTIVGASSAIHALSIVIGEYGSIHDFNAAQVNYFSGNEPSDLLKQVDLNQLQRMYAKAVNPAILFTAILLLGSAVSDLYRNAVAQGPFLLKVSVGVMCTYSFIAIGIRLYLILLVTALVFIARLECTKSSVRRLPAAIYIAAVIAVVCLLFWDQIIMLTKKITSTGSNGRFVEWEGVIRYMLDSKTRLVFGEGWGAVWGNPILGSEVRFTHSFLSFLLLKSGVLGLVTAIYMVVRGVRALASNWPVFDMNRKLLFIAGISAVLPMLFHTTYKSLSTGIILVILVLVYRSVSVTTASARQQ